MEIVVRTGEAETVVRPQGGSAETAGAATNAGTAPSGPGESGMPPANVAATEPRRAASAADQSAGEAPQLG
jgi:hypothetical protein